MTPPVLSPCEVSWFSALCDDDYEFLGAPDPRLQSSFAHCRDIAAERGGDLEGCPVRAERRGEDTLVAHRSDAILP